jgi:hypothetical protein
MNGFQIHKVQGVSMVTGASFAGPFDVRGANQVALEIPTFGTVFTTATPNVYINAAASGGTFVRVKAMGTYSSSSGIQDWEIAQGPGNYIAYCPVAVGFTQIQVQFSTTVSGNGGVFTPRVHVME